MENVYQETGVLYHNKNDGEKEFDGGQAHRDFPGHVDPEALSHEREGTADHQSCPSEYGDDGTQMRFMVGTPNDEQHLRVHPKCDFYDLQNEVLQGGVPSCRGCVRILTMQGNTERIGSENIMDMYSVCVFWGKGISAALASLFP